jgi:polyhydroxyalkanoate synthase subunit PhaE
MAATGWNGLLQFQREFLEVKSQAKRNSSGQEMFSRQVEFCSNWTNLYKKEFRRFLQIPPLGLNRFHQERMGEVLDKFNLFQGKVLQFLFSLFLPVERSFKGAQDRLEALMREGKISEDPKEYYQTWIKVLEDYYLSFLRSSDYSETMKGALDALAEFMLARQTLLQSFLQMQSIATDKDIDDLSSEIYGMKRRIKELESQLENARPLEAGERPRAQRPSGNGRGRLARYQKPGRKGELDVRVQGSRIRSLQQVG